jgi:hypothetical protein
MREALQLFAQAELKQIAVKYAASLASPDKKPEKKKAANRHRIAA